MDKMFLKKGFFLELSSNAIDQFQSYEQFSAFLTWHHRLFAKSFELKTEEECAFKCLTSCGINAVCDYYSFYGHLCALGNLDFQLNGATYEIDSDCLPLSKIMYNKNKIAGIIKLLFVKLLFNFAHFDQAFQAN